MTFIGEPMSDEQATQIVEKMLNLNKSVKRSAYWLIIEQCSGAKVGIQSISNVTSFSDVAEAGIILNTHAEGKHYPYEALSGMFDYVFEYLDVDWIIQLHQQGNRAVTRFVKRLGFSKTTECTRDENPYFLSILSKKDWLTRT
jgi:RimJ/RimL family protein N-acetyltransferase